MSEYFILDTSSAQTWNKYLKRLPIEQQDIYFTPEYYQLYEDYGDGNALCFIFEKEGDVALYPFLINSINKLGYNLDKEYFDIQGAYGYNGVVSSSYKDAFISDFYTNFSEYVLKNNIIAEFTRFHPLIKNKMFSEKKMNIYFDRKTVYLELDKEYETIFKNFQTSTRKQINRCHHKYNLTVEIIENELNYLEDFYSIYKDAMDRVNSIDYLYFNLDYFRNLILKTTSAIFIVKYKEKPIAATSVFYNKNYIHGHLGGTLTEYLFTSSFSLLYSEMIKYGIDKGCKYFHVGGGNSGSFEDPLFKFKTNFSNTTADFYIGKKIYNQEIYDLLIAQWSKNNPEKVEKYKNFMLKYRY